MAFDPFAIDGSLLDAGPTVLPPGQVLIHARTFVGVFRRQFAKISQESRALLGQKLTKTQQWLQERTWDTLTKGLSWVHSVDSECFVPLHSGG